MSSRRRCLSTVLVALLMACGASSCGSESTSSTAPEPTPGPIELTQGDACGDAYFWAATASGDVAVTVTVKVRKRSVDDPTTVQIVLPDAASTVRVLRGRNMVANFCNDALDRDKFPTSEQDAVAGKGTIVLDPTNSDGRSACGATRGTLRLTGIEAEDGTKFAPITVESNNIGCYAG